MKENPSGRIGLEDAIDDDAVEVQVGIEQGAEAVDEDHCPDAELSRRETWGCVARSSVFPREFRVRCSEPLHQAFDPQFERRAYPDANHMRDRA